MDSELLAGVTEQSQEAAREMTSGVQEDIKRDLVSYGAHEVVVELGHHTKALEPKESDFLTVLLIEEGLNGLERYGLNNHSEYSPS